MSNKNFWKQAAEAERSMNSFEEAMRQLHTSDCVRIHDEWVCSPDCNVLEQMPWLTFVLSWDDKLLKPEICHGRWFGSGEPDCLSYPAELFTKEQVAKENDIPVEDVEECEGWGARLSAPGYLDSTEWQVFDTEKEAREYLMETYGDDG